MSFMRKFKLEELCLHVIVENLKKLIYSHNVPQIHIDFLRQAPFKELVLLLEGCLPAFHFEEDHNFSVIESVRCYSEDIFKKLGSIRYSEDCVLWFLNRHNKKICLRTVSERILTRLQVLGPTITSLSLRKSDASEDTINSIMCYVPQVTYLDLSYTQCSDKTLLCIQRICSNLTTLNLFSCENVGDNGMENLCGGNLSLRNLNLIGTDVEYAGLHDILRRMPLIECLKHDEIVEAVYDIYVHLARTTGGIHFNLTEFIYEDGGIHDPSTVLSSWTIMCPNVKKVHVKSFTTTTKKILQICTKFKKLEDLKIEYYHFYSDDESYLFSGMYSSDTYPEDALVPFAVNVDTLTTLSLINVTISFESLMQCYKNVKNLKLESVTFIEFAEEKIKLEENKLYSLYMKSLSLQNSATCRAILHLLSVSKNVTDLHIEDIREMPKEIFDTILNSMNKLSYMNFYCILTEFSYLLSFLEIPSLKAFNIPYFDSSSPVFKQYVTRKQPCTLSWYYSSDCSDESDCESENSENSFDFSHFK